MLTNIYLRISQTKSLIDKFFRYSNEISIQLNTLMIAICYSYLYKLSYIFIFCKIIIIFTYPIILFDR